MTGYQTFDALRAAQTREVLAAADQRSRELRAELLLAELQKLQDSTQAEVAAAVGMKPSAAAGPPAADDLPVGTLRKLVAALGGRLEIAVVLPTGQRMHLAHLAAGPVSPG